MQTSSVFNKSSLFERTKKKEQAKTFPCRNRSHSFLLELLGLENFTNVHIKNFRPFGYMMDFPIDFNGCDCQVGVNYRRFYIRKFWVMSFVRLGGNARKFENFNDLLDCSPKDTFV